MRIGGVEHDVRVVIREDNNGHFYYDFEKSEAPPVPRDVSATDGRTFTQPATTEPQGGNLRPSSDGINLTLNQPEKGPVLRGSFRLSDGQAIISLFRARDLSTLLHESGHLFLDEMIRDGLSEDAPQGVRDDLAAVLKWMGVASADDIGTEQHEQFARGFEQYLMEGKAPSAVLAPAFARFKAWLISIYRTVAGLNVEISPEMRDVFNRLLATDDEIDRAQRSQTPQLFATAEQAGMTDAEFAAYQKSVERARGAAEQTLLDKVMASIRRWCDTQAYPVQERRLKMAELSFIPAHQ